VEKGKFRASQNVLFELVFFNGKLGRKSVMPLFREDADLDMLWVIKRYIFSL
jgi:predicted nucleotide-binding protein